MPIFSITRRERVLPGTVNETGKRRDLGNLDRPQAKPVLREVLRDPVDRRVAFLASQTAGQELAHARVGIEHGKRRAVAGTPATQQ
jgi:hypothetical protein